MGFNLGFQEIFLIFIIALIVFGPRKLPELGKTLGQALGQFRRASEDFKKSWEQEVEVEKRRLNEAVSPSVPYTPASNTLPTLPPNRVVEPDDDDEDDIEPAYASLPSLEKPVVSLEKPVVDTEKKAI